MSGIVSSKIGIQLTALHPRFPAPDARSSCRPIPGASLRGLLENQDVSRAIKVQGNMEWFLRSARTSRLLKRHPAHTRRRRRIYRQGKIRKGKRAGNLPLSAFWCRSGDSNSRPTHYECVALPTELLRRRGASISKSPATDNSGRNASPPRPARERLVLRFSRASRTGGRNGPGQLRPRRPERCLPAHRARPAGPGNPG